MNRAGSDSGSSRRTAPPCRSAARERRGRRALLLGRPVGERHGGGVPSLGNGGWPGPGAAAAGLRGGAMGRGVSAEERGKRRRHPPSPARAPASAERRPKKLSLPPLARHPRPGAHNPPPIHPRLPDWPVCPAALGLPGTDGPGLGLEGEARGGRVAARRRWGGGAKGPRCARACTGKEGRGVRRVERWVGGHATLSGLGSVVRVRLRRGVRAGRG